MKPVVKAAGIALLAAVGAMQAYAGVVTGQRIVLVQVNSADNRTSSSELRLECVTWSVREGSRTRYLPLMRTISPATRERVAVVEHQDGCPVQPFWRVWS